jgi:hypothetical protein
MVDTFRVLGSNDGHDETVTIRQYFLRAHVVEWDFAPSGMDQCGAVPTPFEGDTAVNTIRLFGNETDNDEGLQVRCSRSHCAFSHLCSALAPSCSRRATPRTPMRRSRRRSRATRTLVSTALSSAPRYAVQHLVHDGPHPLQVGDLIKITFFNDIEFPLTVHPHGVLYLKDGGEGACIGQQSPLALTHVKAHPMWTRLI